MQDLASPPTVVAAEELEPADVSASAEAFDVETIFVRQLRFFVGICSIAAGILHVLAMAAHYDHHPTLGRAFLMVAALQVVWGVLLFVQPHRLVVAVGVLATVGMILVWIFSRTKGISWFPGLHDVEPLEWRDIVTEFFQLLAVAGGVVLLLPARVHRPAGRRVEVAPVALMAALASLALGVLYTATHDYVHGGNSGGTTHVHTP